MSTSSTTSPAGFRESLSRLRSAQKPSVGTAAYSRFVNRPAGRYVAAAGHSVGMTPNQATVVSALLSGTGILLIAAAPRGVWLGPVVAALLALGYVMDSVDGQLARLSGGGSKSGEWLDHTVDCFKTSTLHLAVLISWYRFPVADSDWVLLVPVAFEVVAMATYFGLILMPTLRPKTTAGAGTGEENPLRKWVLLLVDYGVVCWVFVLFGLDRLFLVGYSALAVAAALALALALRKWWQELRQLDAQPSSQPG